MGRLACFLAPLAFLLYSAGVLFNYVAVFVVCLLALISGGFLLQLRGILLGILKNFWLSAGLIILLSSWTVTAVITPYTVDSLFHIADVVMVFSFSILLLAALRSLSLNGLLDGLLYQFMASALIILGVAIMLFPPFDGAYICTNQISTFRLLFETIGISAKPSGIGGYVFLEDDLRMPASAYFSFGRMVKIGYGSIFVLAFVPLFIASERSMRLRDWLLALAVFCVVIAVVHITQRRTALLGILCMGLAFLWQQRHLLYSFSWWRSYLLRFWVLFGAAVFVAGLAAVILLIFDDRLDTAIGQTGIFAPLWLIDLSRQAMWLFSFEKIPDAGLFGFGIYQTASIPGAMELSPFDTRENNLHGHPHNLILGLLLYSGWAGMLSFLFCAALLVWPSLRARQDPELLLHVGFFSSSMVNFSLWGHAWWWVCYLFAVAIMRAIKSSKISEVSSA